jgi:hypothetical protein
MTYGPRGVEALGTNRDTVHYAAAAENAERIFQICEAFFSMCIPTIGKKAVSLKQTGRANELVWVPPERWTVG